MTSTTITPTLEIIDVEERLVPVTIITGFLGSGKTTLLNHILQNQQGIKTAVLVNEFGEIGIDNDLIVETGEDMIELNNGCVCCTINGDLINAVHKILSRPEPVDYLVVETTGLADPLPVALTFLGTELRDVTRLDSIITLVDAENYKSSVDLFNAEVSQSQIAYGDIILLNKVDLVDEADVDLLELQIRDMKEGARIIRTNNSQVSIPMILSVGLFESDKYLETPADKHEHHDHQHDDHAHDHAHEHDHAEHQHDDHTNCDHDHGKCEHEGHDHSHHLENDGFTSLSFISDRPFSLRKFQYFLDNQLTVNIFRAKGFLWFDESDKCHVFHLCGKRFSIDDSEWKGEPQTKFVVIGQNLDRDKIRSQIEKCLTSPKTTAGKGFGK